MDNLALSDFLLVFLSIIYGYIVTVYLTGWSSILHDKPKLNYYWLHTFWTILGFLFTIQAWWGLWPDRATIGNNFFTFSLSLLVPIQLYFLVTYLLPISKPVEETNFKIYFYRNRRAIFVITSTLLITMIINSLIFKGEDFLSDKNIFRIPTLLFVISLTYIEKRWIHEIAPIVLFIALIGFIGLHRYVLP